jgi:hypothetical protein
MNEKLNSKSFYDIIASCGHPNRIKYDMFKAQQCGVRCKACTLSEIKTKLIEKPISSIDIEYNGFCYLRDILQPTFEVQKCPEGTLADFAIRLAGCVDDNWIPIQLKVTQQRSILYSDNYTFRIGKSNYDILVLLLCLEDKRIWVFNGVDIHGLETIKIGKKASKYDSYFIPNITDYFVHQWNIHKKCRIEKINLPISKYQQLEQQYRRRREKYLPFIEFVYPERDGTVYDFTVNSYKVQEKVASIQTKRGKKCTSSFMVNLSRSGNAHAKKGYNEGDNDFYWINIPDSTKFFIIPENVLLINGKIARKGETISKQVYLGVYPTPREQSTSNWMHHYIYDYNTVTPQDIKDIFGIL